MMRNPSHPGELIKHDCIEALDITITTAADALGVTRKTLSELVNCKSGISPEMAIRLEKTGWGTADAWLRMQLNYDLWRARQKSKGLKVSIEWPSSNNISSGMTHLDLTYTC